MTHVLVVDDDAHILRTLRIHLAAHGYTVVTADTGRTAIAAAAADRPDLVVLDLGLPDIDGTAVITALRQKSTVPIIVLSARRDAPDKVHALDIGADDYVTKPFGIAELLARMRAAVRRSAHGNGSDDASTPGGGETVVHTAAFTLDLAARKVSRGGDDVRLTPTEWAILDILVRHRGALVTQRRLLTAVWGPNYRTQTNYLRVYLAQLRQKLEPEPSRPRYLITEPGMGYRFEATLDTGQVHGSADPKEADSADDLARLRESATRGDRDAEDQLVELAGERGDLNELRRLADSGNRDAVDILVESAGERQDLPELRRLADAGSSDARDILDELVGEDATERRH